jgi:isoleucyl-tRNA synthetase
MSKSLRNYPDVNEVFDRDGSDAMRWFLLSSTILRGGNLSVTEQGIREGVRQALLPLWNSYYFFTLYANAANYVASPSHSSTQLLDRYILSKTADLIRDLEADLDLFDSYSASAKVRDFAEILTNWYIRRSRDRFWEGDKDAFDTLYTVLEAVLRAVAPLLPLTAEEMWRGLTGGRSVHLESWPDAGEFPSDSDLVSDMDTIREAASVGQALRKSAGLRVRLPLSSLTIASNSQGLAQYADLIADELNVKSVEVVAASEEIAQRFGISKSLTINARALGPRVGGDVQRIIREAKAGNWVLEGETVLVDGTSLVEGEYELTMTAASDNPDAKVGITSFGFVLLDTKVTEELEREGIARDAIRHIQQARKDAGLDVSDRIALQLSADDHSVSALNEHREFIASEVLALELSISSGSGELSVGESGSLGIELHKIG